MRFRRLSDVNRTAAVSVKGSTIEDLINKVGEVQQDRQKAWQQREKAVRERNEAHDRELAAVLARKIAEQERDRALAALAAVRDGQQVPLPPADEELVSRHWDERRLLRTLSAADRARLVRNLEAMQARIRELEFALELARQDQDINGGLIDRKLATPLLRNDFRAGRLQ